MGGVVLKLLLTHIQGHIQKLGFGKTILGVGEGELGYKKAYNLEIQVKMLLIFPSFYPFPRSFSPYFFQILGGGRHCPENLGRASLIY